MVQTSSKLKSVDEIIDFIFRDRAEYQRLIASALMHELNTPLIIMRGRAESLIRYPGQNAENGLREISRECQNLIKVLEALTSVVPSKSDFKIQNLPLAPLVKDVLIYFEKTCLERGISLKSEIPDDIRVETEPGRLRNILISLTSNAVDSFDHMEAKGSKSILLHTQEDSKNLYLTVSDTGCGMSLAVQNQIREGQFFSTKDEVASTGLGLALVRKMTHDLKIDLTFVSSMGKGTSFSLCFPRNIHSFENLSPIQYRHLVKS